MPLLHWLNPRPRLKRWARKSALVGLVTLLVMYPKPWMLAEHIHRGLDLDGLIQPRTPGLDAIQARAHELALAKSQHPTPLMELSAVERAVYERLPYAFDWQTLGAANYLVTPAEALAMGRCDCKGRAAVAASVLRNMGYQSRLVADLTHMWVWTPQGQTMSPKRTASGRRLIDAGPEGNRVDLRAVASGGGLLVDAPTSLAFAISVFPPLRTGLIALAVWAACLRARPRCRFAITGLVLIGAALGVLAWSCNREGPWAVGGAWSGIVLIGAGLWFAGRGAGAENEKARPLAATGP